MNLEGERLMSFHETDRRFGKTNGFTRALVDRGLLQAWTAAGETGIG